MKPEKKEEEDAPEPRSRSASNAGSDDEAHSDISPLRRPKGYAVDSDQGTVVSAAPPAKPNYFKNVSENKEVAKLTSLLSTVINSQKKEVTTALGDFNRFDPIWKESREDALSKFLESDPKLSEFEAQILHYKDLEQRIMEEPESTSVGAIALFTGVCEIDRFWSVSGPTKSLATVRFCFSNVLGLPHHVNAFYKYA